MSDEGITSSPGLVDIVRKVITRAISAMRSKGNVGTTARIMVVGIIALFGNVGSGLLTAAFLGPDGRGEQAALMIMPSILGAVCTLGLHASLIYNVRNDEQNASEYFGTAIILGLISSLVACAVGWLVLPHYLSQYSASTIDLARVLLFCVPFAMVNPLLTGALEVHGRFGVANKVLYVQSLGTLVLLLVIAFSGYMTPHITAWAYIAPCVPAFLYLWLQARKVIRPTPTLKGPRIKRLMSFGLRFYGVDILGGLSGYVDQAVIVFLLDPASVGAYAVALSLSRVLSVAQGAVATVLFPSVAGREASNVVEVVARVTRVLCVVNGALAACVAIAGPTLLLLLYGSRFSAAVTPFLILLLEAVITSAARTLAQAFSSSGKPGAVTTIEFVGVAASIGAMLVLVPMFGINGAACATLFAGVVRLISVAASFHRVLGIKLPRLIISRADIAWVAKS
jgi:O-antigen/teichoic acid export membrane protein